MYKFSTQNHTEVNANHSISRITYYCTALYIIVSQLVNTVVQVSAANTS